MMGKQIEITWLPESEEKDLPAAKSYLGLHYGKKSVKAIMSKIKRTHTSQFKAKDIFRASGLSSLGVSNSHVEKDRNNIKNGEPLSPILLVRDKYNDKLIIADGYHRMCAVYSYNEDEQIPCKIVGFESRMLK
jgi:hypothetical protein